MLIHLLCRLITDLPSCSSSTAAAPLPNNNAANSNTIIQNPIAGAEAPTLPYAQIDFVKSCENSTSPSSNNEQS